MSVHNGNPDWRTRETFDKYLAARAEPMPEGYCPLCEAPSIKEFTYWRIIDNKFPYDRVADIHHQLVPKRHVTFDNVSQEEKEEMENLITGDLNSTYAMCALALPNTQSIPSHVHYHLMVLKPFSED